MKRDSRLSSVLHALLHMAEQDRPMTSEALGLCLGTNPVVVRRTMGLLREAGLVTAERGHAGGWRIAADLETVSLRRLHEALGEPAIFAIGNRNEMPDCLVEQSVNAALEGAFAEAEDLPFDLLSDHWPHGAVAREYGVFDDGAGCALRGSFLVDPSGTIRWQVLNGIGEPRDIVEHLRTALADR